MSKDDLLYRLASSIFANKYSNNGTKLNIYSKQNIMVFRSNIDDSYKAAIVCAKLKKMDGVHRVNVDLDDCENILRLKCDPEFNEYRIQQAISQLGFECDELLEMNDNSFCGGIYHRVSDLQLSTNIILKNSVSFVEERQYYCKSKKG